MDNNVLDATSVEVASEEIESTEIKENKLIFYSIIKRIFDLFCSIIGIVLMIPIALVVKISYMLTGDFHSIFFTQKRIGKGGKEFNFYKFRTMVPNADEVLFKLLKQNKKLAKEYKVNKKLKHDPRVTKMGKLLRKVSLDELPQVFNILKGDMAVIGNRPYLPREKDDMGDYFKTIVKTKPGLTGYWQVSGRSDVSFQKRLELESYYSLHRGLKMDLRIFFLTFSVVLFGKGAK